MPSSSSQQKSKTTHLPVDQLQPNPFQPRSKIQTKDIQDLIKSVKEHGILEPLLVAHTPAGYQIIAGERRWRAAKAAELKEIPVLIKKTSRQGMLELALVENVQREDLNPIERATGFNRLLTEFDFSRDLLAEKIGKSKSYIASTLALLRLPDTISDGLIDGVITEGHAQALGGIQDPALQVECYRAVVDKHASVRETEKMVRMVKRERVAAIREKAQCKEDEEPPDPEERVRQCLQDPVLPEAKELEARVKKLLRSPVEARLSRSSRQTRVVITLRGDRKQTEADLKRLMDLFGQNS
jgi:ParB family chromosome partitioning protein